MTPEVPSHRLRGRTAIVTGAAQGLGASFAIALADAGAKVMAADIADTTATCEAILQRGGEGRGIRVDVTEPSSVAALIDETLTAFGAVHILVNNAALSGQLRLKALTDISSLEWDRVMAVNARGPFECVKAVVTSMRRQRYGKIINIASGTAIKGSPRLLHYVASKGAVIAMTRAMARELGTDGICVNCIAPGLTMSEATRSNADWSGEMLANNIASRALQRNALPEDLLGALLFLSSPESDFITGQTVAVDGGSVMI
jgi:NAD(P)-dependent dehydrogenase (short-subunit alcohol dehydrogenase family)